MFISHATPDDNNLARWLAFRLTREGYRVWVDLEELRGGEDWWRDIEGTIRNRTAKFLICMSRKSNNRDGVLKEVRVANTVARSIANFIVPLRVDDLPFGEFNIEVARINGIDFSGGWAAAFEQLLDVLRRSKVPTPVFHGPDKVAGLWDRAFAARSTVTLQDETLGSNWLSVDEKPSSIWWHVRDGTLGFDAQKFAPPFPVIDHGRYFLSYANGEDLAAAFEAADSKISRSGEIDQREFVRSGLAGLGIDKDKARDFQIRLLRLGIEAFFEKSGLKRYEMANKRATYWFSNEKVGTTRFRAKRPNGSEAMRALVGNAKGNFWHFAIELRPAFRPIDLLAVVPHVIFSENDVVIESTARQHSLRRYVCKQWFNDQWFDRIIIGLAQLADGQGNLVIPLGTGASLTVSTQPLVFVSPVTYVWGDGEAKLADEALPEDGEFDAEDDDDVAEEETGDE